MKQITTRGVRHRRSTLSSGKAPAAAVTVAEDSTIPIRKMKCRAETIFALVILILHQAYGLDNAAAERARQARRRACERFTYNSVDRAIALNGSWSDVENTWLCDRRNSPRSPQKKCPYHPDKILKHYWCSAKLSEQQISSMEEHPVILAIHLKTQYPVTGLRFESYDEESMPNKFTIFGVSVSGARTRIRSIINHDPRDTRYKKHHPTPRYFQLSFEQHKIRV